LIAKVTVLGDSEPEWEMCPRVDRYVWVALEATSSTTIVNSSIHHNT